MSRTSESPPEMQVYRSDPRFDNRQTINIAGLDLVSLQLVMTCAQRGSLKNAAPQCNMSLAAASRRLSLLEARMGFDLFERGRHGLKITPAGEVVSFAAAQVFGRIRAMVADLRGAGM